MNWGRSPTNNEEKQYLCSVNWSLWPTRKQKK